MIWGEIYGMADYIWYIIFGFFYDGVMDDQRYLYLRVLRRLIARYGSL